MDDSTEEASSEIVSKPKPPPAPSQPLKEEAADAAEEEEEIPTLCPNTGMLLTSAGDLVKQEEKPPLEDNEEKKMDLVEERKPEIEEDKETVGEPLYEEDIIDGFSICSFKDYEDLEVGTQICIITERVRVGSSTELCNY